MRKLGGILFVVAMVAVGCRAVTSVPSSLPAVGDSVAKIEVYNAGTGKAIDSAQPYTNPSGRIYLAVAKDGVAGISTEVAIARKELDTARQQTSAMATENARQKDQLEAYSHRWLGDETVRWAKIVLAIYVGLGVVGLVLKTYTGGIFGQIGGNIIGLLPAANPFIWLGKWLASFKTSAAVLLPVPAPSE